MPDFPLSIGSVTELVSSTAKAFDDLYGTMRKVAIDGWVASDHVFRAINTAGEVRKAKKFIIMLRLIQIEKIECGVELSYSTSVDVIIDRTWIDIERVFRKIIKSVANLESILRSDDSFIISSALNDNFRVLVRSIFVRGQFIVGFIDSRKRMNDNEIKKELAKLIQFLDIEAKFIGHCADLLTEFVEARTKSGA
jgi:hypothetical protein